MTSLTTSQNGLKTKILPMPNLTPSEIEKKAEAYKLTAMNHITKDWDDESVCNYTPELLISLEERKQGYIAAKLEDAAEIKRLREGIDKALKLTEQLEQLLNSQP